MNSTVKGTYGTFSLLHNIKHNSEGMNYL